MKTVFRTGATVMGLLTLTLIATNSAAAAASPSPQHESYCIAYGEGGTDCSFSSMAQCQATASGLDAECSPALLPSNTPNTEGAFARMRTPRRSHDQ